MKENGSKRIRRTGRGTRRDLNIGAEKSRKRKGHGKKNGKKRAVNECRNAERNDEEEG